MNTTIDKQELFDDYWQEMHERGGVFDIFDMVGIDLSDAVEGILDDEQIKTHYYFHIAPAEVNKKTQDKIIEHYGGVNGMIEFMAGNADWEKYQDMEDRN